MKRRGILVIVSLVIVALPLLLGCGVQPTPAPTTPAAAPTAAPAVATTAPATAAPTVTAPASVPPTAVVTAAPPTAKAPQPKVGGTFVRVINNDPDTLDPQKSSMSIASAIMREVGGALVAHHPMTGEYVPYLADSWTVSPDGLTWTFKLKKGVKFHNGTPCTAQDWVYTIQRALDPATKSPSVGPTLTLVESEAALDDFTLQMKLKQPYFPFMLALADTRFQPMSKAAVDAAGDAYGRNPVGVGPFKVKQWLTGQKVVLERNPDYAWYPAFVTGGGPYLQSMEFRVVPEYATIIAGLETGEISLYSNVENRDLPRVQDKFQVYNVLPKGNDPFVHINCNAPPLDDVRVRQALALATKRDDVLKAAVGGNGLVQVGPMSSSTAGYWPGVEALGKFDLAAAKALMKDAGYTEGADGMLQKGGEPLKLTLQTPGYERFVKAAQILQDQYKALGVAIEIRQLDYTATKSGRFQMLINGFGYQDIDILYLQFGSNAIGGQQYTVKADPELDALLTATRTTIDPAKRQEAANAVQKRFVDQAYIISLYTPYINTVIAKNVKGVQFSATVDDMWLIGAYMETQ